MDYAAIVAIEIATGIALLGLSCLGLAVIFGMMRVINLAHGEFLVLGSYAAIIAVHQGVNFWLATLVVPPIVVGVIGVVIERSIIAPLYGRMVDTMLATWGLSLFIIGALTTVFGDNTEGISAPLGSIQIGPYTSSFYNLVVVFYAFAALGVCWLVLRFTRAGLFARGTMQNADMANALGVNTNRVYAGTFAAGAALAGLAGGILAPVAGVFPTIGGSYIGPAFITVIGGGASVLTGTAVASALFGAIGQGATFAFNPVFGQVALLIVAVILIRVMPRGITGRFLRGAI